MPRGAQVSVTITRDAAADLREVRAAMSRHRERVPTVSQVIRDLAAMWKQASGVRAAGHGPGGGTADPRSEAVR
jgi:hypothetical protein